MNIDEEILEESSFVHLLEDRGAIRERIQSILDIAEERFGTPTAEQEKTLRQTKDLVRLRSIGKRALTVISWEELLQE